MRGAVLTGGNSRRMGRTKALVEVGGSPMAARVAAALLEAACAPVELIGGDAVELAPLGFAVVADLHPGEGPLGGVLTALATGGGPSHDTDDVVVVACDLPHLTSEIVARLAAAARSNPAAPAVVARTDRIQPSCALWRPVALVPVVDAFREGERSLHRVLRAIGAVEVPVDRDALVNVNTPSEVADAGR